MTVTGLYLSDGSVLIKRIIVSALAAMMILAAAGARADDLATRVNIALDDGTIMIYIGSAKGVNVGDEFEVTRGGQRVGLFRVTRVKELFSYCEILEGEAQEMDTVTRVKAAPASAEPGAKPKTEQGKTAPAATEGAEGAKPENEDKTTRSSRRDKAAVEDKQPGEKTGQPASAEPKTKPKTEQGKAAPAPEAGGKKTGGLPPIGDTHSSALGLTGALFTPSANISHISSGSAIVFYADASDESLNYKATGFGVGYSLGGDVEASYMYISYDTGSENGSSQDDNSVKSNVISFKYQLKNKAPISFLRKRVPEMRYATGFQYFDRGSNPDASSENSKDTASRFFIVGTANYMSAYENFGIYYQGGGLDEDYDGFGFMGSIEYPFVRGKNPALDQMSAILEYDHKAVYLGTYRTISLGFQYRFSEFGHVGLAMADLASTNTLVLNGAYNF